MDRLNLARKWVDFPSFINLEERCAQIPRDDAFPAEKRQGFRIVNASPGDVGWKGAERHRREGEDAVVPHGAGILNSTRKEIAMSDKEKVALTKLTSKGG